jgi:hypothetical protein
MILDLSMHTWNGGRSNFCRPINAECRVHTEEGRAQIRHWIDVCAQANALSIAIEVDALERKHLASKHPHAENMAAL